MNYLADLHVHSHYSRATSKASHLHGLAAWAAVKGIAVVATGDWRRVRGGSPLSWTDVREDAHSGWQVAWLQQADCLRDNAPVND